MNIDALIGKVNTYIINPIIGFLFALAVLYFLYGVVKFILNQDNEEAKSTGKQHMIWGIIGMAIMLGVWGILGMVLNTFGITGIDLQGGNADNITLPTMD